MNVKNIDRNKCINCGMCEYYCKMDAITFNEDYDGFEYPDVNDNCVECGLCVENCIVNGEWDSTNRRIDDIQAFVGRYSKSEETKKSTSGGFCNALSECVIEQGGVVFGVTYSTDYKDICYKSAETKEELEKFRSVKYAQSKCIDMIVLEKVLETGRLVLVIGLPCMITAITKWSQKRYNNLLTIALICHGPTSKLVHRKFLEEYAGGKKITSLNLRKKRQNKSVGWLEMTMENDSDFVKPWLATAYQNAFSILIRKSCYSCEFKLDKTQADFLVGDYWGAGTDKLKNRQGMSAIILLNNEKKEYINKLRNFVVDDMSISDIIADNPVLNIKVKENPAREKFVDNLQKMSLSSSVNGVLEKKKKIYGLMRAYAMVILPSWLFLIMKKIARNRRKKKY